MHGPDIETDEVHVDNGEGHLLYVKRMAPRSGAIAGPVLLVPGYGMNSFILGFHPTGPSLMEHLAARGLEVFSCDLRGQGRTQRTTGNFRYGLSDLARTDVRVLAQTVTERSSVPFPQLGLVGCSMGAALALGAMCLHPSLKVSALVTIAGAVTWRSVHPAVRLLFTSSRLAGAIPIRGTRRAAEIALPALARHAPWLLAPYLRTETTEMSRAREMTATVEDPHPQINSEIATWVRGKDLILDGVNVSQGLRSLHTPLLCVLGNQDGIVPPGTARAHADDMASADKTVLAIGTKRSPFAHGDLFVGTGAQTQVFEPIAEFLTTRLRSD